MAENILKFVGGQERKTTLSGRSGSHKGEIGILDLKSTGFD
jgi:hypothetical protein